MELYSSGYELEWAEAEAEAEGEGEGAAVSGLVCDLSMGQKRGNRNLRKEIRDAWCGARPHSFT